MARTIPDSHLNRLTFFTELLATLTTNATVLGFNAARLTEITALLQPLIDKYTILVAAEKAATDAAADADVIFGQNKPDLQNLVDELRTSPKCSGALLSAMNLIPANTVRDTATIKPSFTLQSEAGHVRVQGTKNYAELYNVYMRPVGVIAWKQVGYQRKKFPFDDETPLLVAGVPEVREYLVRGVINDEEIGLPSDIVTVTYAG